MTHRALAQDGIRWTDPYLGIPKNRFFPPVERQAMLVHPDVNGRRV